MSGTVSKAFSDRAACLADLDGLRESARRDGLSRCRSFCRDMGCEPRETAARQVPGAFCTVRNAETLKSYGIGNTGQFVCVCVAP